jgi:hypothetical protein
LIKDFESIKSEIMKEHKKQIANIVNILKKTDLQRYDEKKFKKILNRDIELESLKYVPVSDDLNDENSLYSAISILLFGDEMNYKHIRLSIVYMLLKNDEYKKEFKDDKMFESLVEQIVKDGFHSEFPLPVVANLLDRTLMIYNWEKFTELPEIYQPELLEKEKEINSNDCVTQNAKDPLIIAKKNNRFIPLLKKDI